MLFWKSAVLFGFLVDTVLATRRVRSILDGNNACKFAKDYENLATSKNCFFHEDSTLDGNSTSKCKIIRKNTRASIWRPDKNWDQKSCFHDRELIHKYAPAYEEYKITTDDGYYLTIFRIPRANPKAAVLMIPTMLSDTKLLMVQGNESIPMLLWKAGYDMWFYNTRGTLHSEGHVNMSVTDYEYWDFSLEELGIYDMPKTIDLIKSKTDSKIFTYGTSMGATITLIYASMLPEHARNSVHGLMMSGPAVYFRYSSSPLATVMPLIEDVGKEVLRTLRLGNMFPAISTVATVVRFAFRIPFFMYLCHWIVLLLFGWTWNEFDPAILNADAPLMIRDVAYRIPIHFLQIERAKTRFQRYNFGPQENMKKYGTAQPPRYPLENLTVPIFILISDSDTLTAKRDSEDLFVSLPPAAKKYKPAYISGMNHGDYSYGKHRKENIVVNLLKFMEQARHQ